ncbi:MAG TPA: hypothetical protein VMC09_12010 [Anaerolineales bacterium]|nr:hypothetical protein [Anaerolineales bacterium]
MSTQTVTLHRFSSPLKGGAESRQERVDRLQPPEQATGPIPARAERTAAEILAERLREADPAAGPQSFVP